ncbi:MAG: hypothetical protein AAFV07_10375, partial [Bacteroidota bacterium]
RFRQLSAAQRILFLLVLVGCVTEVGSYVVMLWEVWPNNLPFLHVYTIVEFILIISIFYHGKPGWLSIEAYVGLLVGGVSIALGNIVFFQGIWEVNSFSRSLESISLILICLLFFSYTLRKLDELNFSRSFMSWFATAILIYFVANLLLFIYSDFIVGNNIVTERDQRIFQIVWSVFNLMNLVRYVLFSIALYCNDTVENWRALTASKAGTLS